MKARRFILAATSLLGSAAYPSLPDSASGLSYWEIEPGMVIAGPPALDQLVMGGVYRFETSTGKITGVLQQGRVPWRRATTGDSVTLLVSRADLTGDGVLDTFDFLAMQDGIAVERWWADWHRDLGRPRYDIFDLIVFQDEFQRPTYTGGTVLLADVVEWERL